MSGFAFAVIAGGVVLFALLSKRLEGGIVTAPMAFTAFGLMIGQAGFGWAEIDFDHGLVHGLAEATLILVLFSDAARIDLRNLRRDHDLPVRMLLIGMPLTIAAGLVVALVLPLGFGLWEAALLAAILAPTDAALGQSVVSSPRVPVRIRQALNVESGLNDGIALPVVLFFACLAGLTHAAVGDQDWILFGAKQIVLGPVAGGLVGILGAWSIDRAIKRDWMSEGYQGPAILAVALLAYASADVIGGNGFIAAFVAGLVFGNQMRGRCHFLFEFAESEGQLLVLLVFLIFGAAILPEAVSHFGWDVLVYAVLSLTVIRMVPVALSLLGSCVRPVTTLFLGWFGPRGLASLLFAILILEEIHLPVGDLILAVTVVTVTLSILAHGVSASPAAKWYGRAVAPQRDKVESKAVPEMPTRHGMVKPQ